MNSIQSQWPVEIAVFVYETCSKLTLEEDKNYVAETIGNLEDYIYILESALQEAHNENVDLQTKIDDLTRNTEKITETAEGAIDTQCRILTSDQS